MPTFPTSISPCSPGVLSGRLARLPLQAVGGSLLMALSAHIAVPFWPVPLTLQTLAVLGLGAAFGPAGATTAIVAWIAEGLLGLPVFAAGTGPAALLGPTGGYIVGCLPAAVIAGLVIHPRLQGQLLKSVAALAAADVVILAFGVGWLAHLIGWEKAVAGGLLPFTFGELLKIGLTASAAQLLAGRGA